jgi:hypothetical protein
VERLGRVVDGLRVASASEIDRRSDRMYGTDGLAQSFGFRRGTELIEEVTGVASATARRRVRLGAVVCPRSGSLGAVLEPLYPLVAAAFAAGQIGEDAVSAITSELEQAARRADPDRLATAERLLVAAATGQSDDVAEDGDAATPDESSPVASLPGCGSSSGAPLCADLVRVQARVWREALDPDGAVPRLVDQVANRRVFISRTPVGGLHPITGMLTPDVASAALAFFDSLITRPGPRFEAADVAEGPIERRDHAQQCHDLFAVMIHAAAAAAEAGVEAGVVKRSPVIISVPVDQLAAPNGFGQASGVEGPVPAAYLAQVACDAGIQIMVTGAHGRIERLGVKGRFFTATQRRAIAARDGATCLIDGCGVPFAALEAHHVVEHCRGGPTHVDNGVLLCWWHHHQIDLGLWQVQMIQGKPHVTVPVRQQLRYAA